MTNTASRISYKKKVAVSYPNGSAQARSGLSKTVVRLSAIGELLSRSREPEVRWAVE